MFPFNFFLQYVLQWGLTEVGSGIRVAHDIAEVAVVTLLRVLARMS